MKPVISKTWGWIILIILVILDAVLDVVFAGSSGVKSGIWRPISNFIGIKNPVYLIPLVLLLLYLLVWVGAWLARKIDKVKIKSEELILTTFVIVYGVFDLWLILVYLFRFNLLPNHYYLIPILIFAGIGYELWAEKKLNSNEKID